MWDFWPSFVISLLSKIIFWQIPPPPWLMMSFMNGPYCRYCVKWYAQRKWSSSKLRKSNKIRVDRNSTTNYYKNHPFIQESEEKMEKKVQKIKSSRHKANNHYSYRLEWNISVSKTNRWSGYNNFLSSFFLATYSG